MGLKESNEAIALHRVEITNLDTTRQQLLPSLKIRIDLDPEGRIGHGKIHLLEAINTCGSISPAGRTMNMSYRHAWLLVDEIASIRKRDVIARRVGGNKGGGAGWTPFGFQLVARYRKIERSVESATRKELLALHADIGNKLEHAEQIVSSRRQTHDLVDRSALVCTLSTWSPRI